MLLQHLHRARAHVGFLPGQHFVTNYPEAVKIRARIELLAERLFGNTQAMNTLLLGLAWQRGLVPVGEAAILRAIELNGAAVGLNKRAFLWGRILADRPQLIDEILTHALDAPPEELGALLSGIDLSTATRRKRYRRAS